MLFSMTGFGRGESTGDFGRLVIEAKSVNHRYCEIIVRMPRGLLVLEEKLRREVQSRISRGRIEIFVTREEGGSRAGRAFIDKSLAQAYYDGLKELSIELGLQAEPSLDVIARMPDVAGAREAGEDPESLWGPLSRALFDCLDRLVAMRETEGAALGADISGRVDHLEDLRRRIAGRAQLLPEEYRQRLQKRLTEVLGVTGLDEARLAAEVALLAERADICEEISRLGSHLDQLRRMLTGGGPVGRKMDFLVQEINRELNTTGSKSSDLEITNWVLEAKGELEKIREQVQNLE